MTTHRGLLRAISSLKRSDYLRTSIRFDWREDLSIILSTLQSGLLKGRFCRHPRSEQEETVIILDIYRSLEHIPDLASK